MYRIVAYVLTPLAFAGLANAQEKLYKHTDAGWDIFLEEKSCAMYADFASGTNLRLSNRVDEDRLYVSFFNSKWTSLLQKNRSPANVYIQFEKQKVVYGSAGIIIGDEGSLGYSGAENWGRIELLTSFALQEDAIISVREGDGPVNEIERFGMTGAREAIEYLGKCSEVNFGSKPLILPPAIATRPLETGRTDLGIVRLRPYYPLLNQYRTCVIAAAAKFSRTKETADLLARSALRSCAATRQKVSTAFSGVLGSSDADRMLGRFDDGFVQDAQLEIVRRRTP